MVTGRQPWLAILAGAAILVGQPFALPALAETLQRAAPVGSAGTKAGSAPFPRHLVTPVPSLILVRRHDGFDRLMLDLPHSWNYRFDEIGGLAHIAFDRPIRLNAARITAALPESLRPFAISDDGFDIRFRLPAGRHLSLTRDGKRLYIDVADAHAAVAQPAPPAPSKIVSAMPGSGAAESGPLPPPEASTGAKRGVAGLTEPGWPEGGGAGEAPVAGALGGPGGLQLAWSLIGEDLSLRFDWHEPTSAAVFRRGAALWVVFDRPAHLDLGQFRQQNLPVVTAIDPQPTASGLALRLAVWPGFEPNVRRAGNSWIVDLSNRPSHPDAPVEPQFVGQGNGAVLDFHVLDPASPISITDPDTQDPIVVVPLPALGQGLASALETPDLDAPSSVQGLAFHPVTDRLAIRAGQNLVEISAPDGLIVSSPSDRQIVRAAPAAEAKLLFDFAGWAGSGGAAFVPRRQALQRAAANAPATERLAARLDLARFFVANAMGHEALGVLQAVQRDTPQAFDDPSLRALRGAAEALMGRPEAAADLDDKSLDREPEIAVWRAAVASANGDAKTVSANVAIGAAALKRYPPELRRRLDLELAEGLVDGKALDPASALIDDALASAPTPGQRDLGTVLAGRVAAIKGDAPKAVALWKEVAASPLASLARAEANYALILAQLDAHEITRAEAIKALDRLRFAWRGDNFEVRLLHKLAALQIEEGDYRDGFASLRRIVANFPASDLTRAIGQEMQEDFVDLFLGKPATEVPPVTALAIYDEFKELTPAGATGDAIVRKLAERLVAIDLLTRAGALLDNQARTRLGGMDQARVATEAAVVRLLDHDPKAALGALDIPLGVALPNDLAWRRQELRASATFEMGDPEGALKLLANDTDDDARRLRIDIYWKTHNWPAASALLLQGLSPPPANQALDQTTAAGVMSAATALALANDRAGLAKLDTEFGAPMAKTALASDFHTLVDAGALATANLDALGHGQSSESFLDAYRQRINSGGLGSLG